MFDLLVWLWFWFLVMHERGRLGWVDLICTPFMIWDGYTIFMFSTISLFRLMA